MRLIMENRKSLPLVFWLALVLLLSISDARELKNNFYSTLQPDSSKCITIKLPVDINLYEEDRVVINLSTQAEANIKFIDVLTSPYNPVNVPICFLSSNKKEGEYFNYSISLSSENTGTEILKGGFCIRSNSSKVAIGRPEANICDFIIKDEKLFDIAFQYGDRIPLTKNKPGKIPVRLYSQNKLDLELSVKSDVGIEPTNQVVRLEPSKPAIFEFEAPALKQGSYPIVLTAEVVVNGTLCDSGKIQFCKKEVSSTLMVDTLGLQGWYIYSTPTSYSAYSAKSIDYNLAIENYGEPREFSAKLNIPKGLISTFQGTKVFIETGGKKELTIPISIQDLTPQNYEIEFLVSGDTEKSVKSYLSFRDTEENVKAYWSDIRDSILPELRPLLDSKVQNYLNGYREKGLDMEEYQELLGLLEQAKGQVFVGDLNSKLTNRTDRPSIKSSKPFDPLFVIVIVVVIIVLISLIFYIKIKNRLPEKEDY